MPKRKAKNKKSFFRPVHLQALVFFIVYTVISKAVFFKSIASNNLEISFFVPYVFGVVAGVIFLYLFSHEDFFHFIKEVEREEKKKEEGYLRKYKHFGKIFSVFIIGAIGGPVFAALTIRFLLNRFWYRYLILAAGNVASTLLAVSIAKGALRLFT